MKENAQRRHATVDLALRLFAAADDHAPAARAQLQRAARLFTEAIIEPVDPPSERRV